MSKLKTYNAPIVLSIVAGFVIAISGLGIVAAQQYTASKVFTGPVTINEAPGGDGQLGAATFVTPGSDFTELRVSGTSEFQATSTRQEIDYGTRYRAILTLTSPTATSTPGGAASLANTNGDKICRPVQLFVNDKLTAGYEFSVASSTSATSIDNTITPFLIATSTAATSTAVVFDGVSNAGINHSWIWLEGTFLNVQFDAPLSNGAQEDRTSAAGVLYVDCHVI